MTVSRTDRIRDLETVLLWEGQIDNQRIREILGVQPVWASRLLAELAASMGRRAERGTSHSPLKLRKDRPQPTNGSPDDYLRVLLGAGHPQEGLEDARMDLSVVEPRLFAAVAHAIRAQTGLEVLYRSMNRPQGTQRVIYPHALVRAPRRWHVRAWCADRQDFRDFTLGRIAQAQSTEEPAPRNRGIDRDWKTRVKIEIVAHPGLSADQRQMIGDEYYPGAQSKSLATRRCLVGYTLHDLSIAVDPRQQRPPEYQLCVLDPKKVLPLFRGSDEEVG